jgi:hypothetical protein
MKTMVIRGIEVVRLRRGKVLMQTDVCSDGLPIPREYVGKKCLASYFIYRPIQRTESPANDIATGTEARVCQDIAERQQKGIAKYGTTVEGNDGGLLYWLRHAYEETLDKAVYLKRAIEQIEKEQK